MGVEHIDKRGPADAGNAESEEEVYGMTHNVHPLFLNCAAKKLTSQRLHFIWVDPEYRHSLLRIISPIAAATPIT